MTAMPWFALRKLRPTGADSNRVAREFLSFGLYTATIFRCWLAASGSPFCALASWPEEPKTAVLPLLLPLRRTCTIRAGRLWT